MFSDSKFRFKVPTTISIIGGSGSGKTCATLDIIRHKSILFEKIPDRVIWCFGQNQELYDAARKELGIEFHEGLLNTNEIDKKQHTLVVLDDLLHDMNEEMSKMFTIYSHHLNMTVIFLSQVLFVKNKHARTITLNTHYIILFRAKRDLHSINRFASQLFPGEHREFMNIYKRHTRQPFSYITIDLHPRTLCRVRIHTGILPLDVEYVYSYY